jgi:tRNA/rRNA methyltransferase
MGTRLENIAIVLVEPHIPENIGSVSRAMANMGMSQLILVRPRNWDLTRVLKTATGPSIDIIEEMDCKEDLLEAIGEFNYVVATTARIGNLRPAMAEPREIARRIVDLSVNNKIAIVFGPEDRGLSNDEIKYAHVIVRIPTRGFSSLNLAQAVLIIAYEIFLASRSPSSDFIPRLANKFELEGMYEHLKEVLTKIGFINPQNPEHWMINIRRFFSKLPLRAKDVNIIRGILRQIDWYTGEHDRNKKRVTPEILKEREGGENGL